MNQSVAGILLAAGSSRRFGRDNKLLSPRHGRPLVMHAARTLAAARRQHYLAETLAVTGYESEKVGALLTPTLERVVVNPDYRSGVASSVRCGLAATAGAGAALFMLADMPEVTGADIAALVCAWQSGAGTLIAPEHEGQRGNPVLVGAEHFAALNALSGDEGARVLFAEHPPFTVPASAGVLFDLDTPPGDAA